MKWIGLIAGALGSVAAMVAGAAPEEPEPALATGYIEKFEVPERDEQGNLRWVLIGDRAKFREDGLMTVLNMRAEFYHHNQVELVFSSPTCVLDQPNRQATTDAPVRFEANNMVVTGIGADWVGASNTFLIRSNVHVVISGRPGPASVPAEEKEQEEPAAAETNDESVQQGGNDE
jgi:hypothetical protein